MNSPFLLHLLPILLLMLFQGALLAYIGTYLDEFLTVLINIEARLDVSHEVQQDILTATEANGMDLSSIKYELETLNGKD